MKLEPCRHCGGEEFEYDHTYDDWWDGDSDDYYRCSGCGKLKKVYAPR